MKKIFRLLLKTVAIVSLAQFFVLVASAAPSDSKGSLGKMAVLDLVDLADNRQKLEISELFRKNLSISKSGTVFSRDSLVKRLNEFNINPNQGCNNPQCSFDIGNIMQADYVVFGTSTLLQSVQAITLKCLHVSSAKIVWTKVFIVDGANDNVRMHGLDENFQVAAKEIGNTPFDLSKTKHGKSLAVLDLSENSLQAKAFSERVDTRISGNSGYDVMSPAELNELFTALEINKVSIVPSLENMVGLGQKLGVSHLLYSRLYRDGRSYIYRLVMYDISGKSIVQEMPSRPSEDYVKLLDYEKIFFNTLVNKEKESIPMAKVNSGSKTNKALWISLGILGVGGGIAAYWVENLHKTEGGGITGEEKIPLPNAPPDKSK